MSDLTHSRIGNNIHTIVVSGLQSIVSKYQYMFFIGDEHRLRLYHRSSIQYTL
jgi:hypothetical protein